MGQRDQRPPLPRSSKQRTEAAEDALLVLEPCAELGSARKRALLLSAYARGGSADGLGARDARFLVQLDGIGLVGLFLCPRGRHCVAIPEKLLPNEVLLTV